MDTETKPNLPLLGDKFPEVEVMTTAGKMTLPDAFKGSWFVLFSHPADFTPVCTTEFVAFQKRIKDFDALNCKLIGLSIDQVFAHIKWIEWIKEKLDVAISFRVIAGTECLALRLGMLHPGKGTNTVRVVFVVDPKGIMRLMLYYPQEVGRNIDEILRIVKALQTSDEQGAMSANWPNNELIGDRVIVPPPCCVEDAEKRLAEHEGFDWWFCHKALKK